MQSFYLQFVMYTSWIYLSDIESQIKNIFYRRLLYVYVERNAAILDCVFSFRLDFNLYEQLCFKYFYVYQFTRSIAFVLFVCR